MTWCSSFSGGIPQIEGPQTTPSRVRRMPEGRDPEYLALARRISEYGRQRPPQTIDEQREASRELLLRIPRPPVGAVEETPIGRLYRPANPTRTCLLFFHGGGFWHGDVEGYDAIVRTLCAMTGVAFLSVEYRLAPEHPFPAGLDDCWEATR